MNFIKLQDGSLFNYNDGGRKAAGYKGSTGDCVCRALTIASGRSYQEIYDLLAHGNASQRNTKRSHKTKSTGKHTASLGISTNRKWFSDLMNKLGFKWIPTMQIGSGCRVHLRTAELPDGRLVVKVSGHMVAVINGVVNDIYDCTRGGKRCVYGFYIPKEGTTISLEDTNSGV